MNKSKRDRPEKPAAETAGSNINLAGTIGWIGRQLGQTVSLHGLRPRAGRPRPKPGAAPGIESIADRDQPPAPGTVRVRCVDYGPDRVETTEVTGDFPAFLKQPRPEWSRVRWLNIDGLHPYIVDQARRHYGFHTLAAEDVLRVPQRPKLESYEGHLFVVVRMLMLRERSIYTDQVSFFLFPDTLLTFQESIGDVWDPVRQRLQKETSRMRTHDAPYLLYALLDAVVDHCFPMLEQYGELLEELETEIIESPSPRAQQRLHAIKRELAMVRRVIWPTREVLNQLHREETTEIPPAVKTYMRDVYDHAVQVMDIVESCRETAAGLNDLYMSSVSNRMNEVMKVLTIMASFFIPITFVAGVYGMNFEVLPELNWKYAYAGFWGVCLVITLALAVFFYRKGWLGRRD